MHEKLVSLLALQKRCRESETIQDFAFIVANETYELVYYKQALFWSLEGSGIEFRSISGNQIIDPDGRYAQYVKKIIRDHLKKEKESSGSGADKSDLSILSSQDLAEYQGAQDVIRSSEIALAIMRDGDGKVTGGLWVERNTPFEDQDIILLQEAAETYGFFLEKHLIHKSRWFLSLSRQRKSFKIALLISLICAGLFPVRLSVSSPAEIVAKNPKVVTIPFDGILENVLVEPGDKVESGQILASMEKTALKSELATSRESYRSVQSELAGTMRLAISSPDKKSSIGLLKAEMALEKLSYNRAETRLAQSDIKALQNGVAVFSDVSELEGKPVKTGERIMMIANTEQKSLRIRVPARSMIEINKIIPAKFYLSISPLKSYEAKIENIGYQASTDPDGLLTYKIKARLDESTKKDLRIGWQGTARVYGAWTVFAYAVLRQPLIFLRRVSGL